MLSLLRKNRPLKNLPLKVLSVVLAVFLWAVISSGRSGRQTEASVNVPVELHNLSSDMEIVKRPPERVDVRLRGPRKSLSNVAALGVTIRLDLAGAPEGETTFEIFASDVRVPPEITVTRISPSTLNLVLEHALSRQLPIQPVLQGRPARGYEAGDPIVRPQVVELRGPRSLLAGLVAVPTTPVVIDRARTDVVQEVNLVLSDARIHLDNRPLVVVTVPVKGARPPSLGGGETSPGASQGTSR